MPGCCILEPAYWIDNPRWKHHYLLGWTSTPWFDRIAIRDVFDDVGSKYVPPHVNIFYCFGGLVFTSFIAQVTTGAAMTFYYVPEVSRSLSCLTGPRP